MTARWAVAAAFSFYSSAWAVPERFPCGPGLLVQAGINARAIASKPSEIFGRTFWLAADPSQTAELEQKMGALVHRLWNNVAQTEQEYLGPLPAGTHEEFVKLKGLHTQLGFYQRFREAVEGERNAIVDEMLRSFPGAPRGAVIADMRNERAIDNLGVGIMACMVRLMQRLPTRVGLSLSMPTDAFIAEIRLWMDKGEALRQYRVLYDVGLQAHLLLGNGRWALAVQSPKEDTAAALAEDIAKLASTVSAAEKWLIAMRREATAMRTRALAGSGQDAAVDNRTAERLESEIAPRETELQWLRAAVETRQFLLQQLR